MKKKEESKSSVEKFKQEMIAGKADSPVDRAIIILAATLGFPEEPEHKKVPPGCLDCIAYRNGVIEMIREGQCIFSTLERLRQKFNQCPFTQDQDCPVMGYLSNFRIIALEQLRRRFIAELNTLKKKFNRGCAGVRKREKIEAVALEIIPEVEILLQKANLFLKDPGEEWGLEIFSNLPCGEIAQFLIGLRNLPRFLKTR